MSSHFIFLFKINHSLKPRSKMQFSKNQIATMTEVKENCSLKANIKITKL